MKEYVYTPKIMERLEEYVYKRGDNFSQLAVAIDVSVGYFPRMRKVKGSLGAEVLVRILMYYRDLSADWLLTGQGSMLRGSKVTAREVQMYGEREKMLKEIGNTVDTLEQNVSVLKQQQSKLNKLR
ncbi:hypothetical protein FACS189452_03740 [Bacteroidia bacterium]|nr:hypothetical protein FACS189452_03740 [Bacteroidia bacterium]